MPNGNSIHYNKYNYHYHTQLMINMGGQGKTNTTSKKTAKKIHELN